MSSDILFDAEKHRKSFESGRRAAFAQMIRTGLRGLQVYLDIDGMDKITQHAGQLAIEREDAIVQLRIACLEYGDMDWEDNLHLGDIIEKHLVCYFPDLEEDKVK